MTTPTPAQIEADDVSDLICRMVNTYSGGTCLCPGDEHGVDTTKAFCFKLTKEITALTAAQVGIGKQDERHRIYSGPVTYTHEVPAEVGEQDEHDEWLAHECMRLRSLNSELVAALELALDGKPFEDAADAALSPR